MKTAAYAAQSNTSPMTPFEIERREPGPHDVQIDILYCGICHSDIHMAHNDWNMTVYPVVPGHEIVGRVVKAGAQVKKFKPGDLVGVGCMVESCRTCPSCKEGLEQYCETGFTLTYGSPDPVSGGMTHGGYSAGVTVNEDFVLSVSEKLDAKAVAPLLCAGITTYSPLRHWKVGKGMKVGVIGLGGLGHMGVKFAAAMGAHVVMITTSPEKGNDAKKLGAHEVLISKDEKAMEGAANSFDFLLNTIPVSHDINPYVNLLRRDATMVIVGALNALPDVSGGGLILKRRSVSGSVIGGIKETQEMLDFCAEHNIVCDVEMIDMPDVNTAFERVMKSDVKYRFVIDMESLK